MSLNQPSRQQLLQQQQNIINRFSLAMQVQMKPLNELMENFQAYINLTNMIIADQAKEIEQLKAKQKEK